MIVPGRPGWPPDGPSGFQEPFQESPKRQTKSNLPVVNFKTKVSHLLNLQRSMTAQEPPKIAPGW
eukprot:5657947-Pyramimonas_sp.AAC.1